MSVCTYNSTIVNLTGSCSTSLVDNSNGTLTFTDDSGNAITFYEGNPPVSFAYNAATSILSLQLTDGTILDADISACCGGGGADIDDVTFTEATRTLTITQGANVFNVVIPETVTTLVDNADGTYTYTSEDATATIITPVAQKHSEIIPIGTTTIDVPHNLNTATTIFQMVDLVTGSVVFPDGRIVLDLNTIRFTFNPATTGQIQVTIN